MLFLHKLLFILLGTSVVAFIHHNPLQELEFDHTNQEPEPEPLRHPELITQLVCVGFIGGRRRLGILQTKFLYASHTPQPDKDDFFPNDIFLIRHDGTITFYQLALRPGQGLRMPLPRVPTQLTAHNYERILGTWSPMPSLDVPIRDRFNLLKFDRQHGEIISQYYVYHQPQMLTSISGTSGGQAPGRPPPFAKGTWNRLPSTDTYEDYRDDVIVLHDGRDPKLYTLTNKPGEMRPQVIPKSGQKSRVTVVTPQTRPRFEVIPKPVSTRRLVDLWRRMPAASVDIQRRRDRLKIEEGVGGIHYRIYEVNPVAQPPAVAAVA
ncbi:hypothetical protein F5887DRAFT_1286442 [Amanita rubescens]|nr:hypothetical protein F5887DRAFT_1286442 [Amanita rubescens]